MKERKRVASYQLICLHEKANRRRLLSDLGAYRRSRLIREAVASALRSLSSEWVIDHPGGALVDALGSWL